MGNYDIEHIKHNDLVFEEEDREISWAVNTGIGQMVFRVNKTGNVYVLFGDYPNNLTKEDKRIFDSEQKFWANFFSGKQ